MNVRSCEPSSFCSKPQPRTLIHKKAKYVVREQRLISYHQCLPGCNATTKKVKVTLTTNYKMQFTTTVPNHTACTPYETTTTQGPSSSHLQSGNLKTKTRTSFNINENEGLSKACAIWNRNYTLVALIQTRYFSAYTNVCHIELYTKYKLHTKYK